MTKKKITKKKKSKKVQTEKPKKEIKESPKKEEKKQEEKINSKKFPTINLKTEHDIAMDFAIKTYKKFDKVIKSIILFGSTTKQSQTLGSDIDIIIVIDDAAIKWDQELIAWYREELEKIIQANPYKSSLHINTIKLTTWWEDLIRGDPLLINILREGQALVDMAGFFTPLKHLLIEGKIKATPESIYSCLQRAPMHIQRSKIAELSSIEGLFWSMVDSAHAALIAANVSPASPEHIPRDLKETFVNSGKLKIKYVAWFRDLLVLHKKIQHRELSSLKGVEIDTWQERAEEFLNTMAKLVNEIIH